jgi:magnesium transporter
MNSSNKTFEEPLPGVAWCAVKMSAENGFKDLAKKEGYHPLDIEDCYHKRQNAKVTDREAYIFVVAKVSRYDSKNLSIRFDDLDMFLKTDSLVTVEEHPSELVGKVCKRFPETQSNIGNISRIVYTILDEIVDDYLVSLDKIGESIHGLESEVWKRPSPEALERIFKIKRALIDFRRNSGGMREVISLLIRHPRLKTDGELENYYRDLYEHSIRVIEFVETYRDVLSGSLEVYLSAVANRTNEITKILAGYGTVALPFLIVTGLYGMNIPLPFQDSPHSFLIVATSMIVLGVGALIYFKKKDWV